VSHDAASLFSLEGKLVVLTGASGFLGRTMAAGLLANGARVVGLGRSERVDQLALGERFLPLRIDMNDEAALRAALQGTLEEHGPADVLVNNAHELGPESGFNVPDGTLERAPSEQWLRHLGGGLGWAVIATQVVGSAMRGRGGSIVNVSSMYGKVAPSPLLYEGTDFVNPPGYSAAKAALLALTRYTASFWGRDGVRANALVPGPFSNTDDEGPNSVAPDDPFVDRLRQRTSLGRVGRPDELVGALLFLASDASSFVTGAEIVVDGGWTVT